MTTLMQTTTRAKQTLPIYMPALQRTNVTKHPAEARESSAERRLTILRRSDFFSILPEPALRVLANEMNDRVYTSGTAIVRAEEEGNGHLYIVGEGEVAVVMEPVDGKETVLATLQPGDFFGEMSLLDEGPCSATVRAIKSVRVFILRREDFRRTLESHPNLFMGLLSEVNRRLRHSNRKVASLSFRSMEGRVASALLGLMDDKGMRIREDGNPRVLIRNLPTQKFLAEMAGTTRESVSRTLADWGRRGLLRAHRHDLFILEEAAIRAM